MNAHSVPLLMYHDVGYSDSSWCITPEQFEAQMSFLHAEGYKTISLSELQEKISQNQPLQEKVVVITFDDGRKGIYTSALPIMKKYGFTATIYIVPSWVEGQNIPAEESYSPILTWDELRELFAAGLEIGSHSFSHKNLSTLNATELEKEFSDAEAAITKKLQLKVTHLAYPYGIYSEEVVSAACSRYETAVTIERGFLKAAGRFARQWVTKETSLETFQRLLAPPKLSVAMIVRNEEKNLQKCLESVRGLADEIVIVDTGSTDTTKEIAARFTDTIFDFRWTDDFAAARNEALKHATGDWILILDADEIIAKEEHFKIKEAMNDWEVSGYQVLTKNYTNATSMTGWQPSALADPYAQSYAGWFPSLKVRLFQQKKGVQFEGRIHEMVDTSIARNGGKLAVLPLPVHHYGGEEKDPAKAQRYLELSQKKVAENPTDAKAYFELGVLYRESGNYTGAEQMFLKSVELDDTHLAPRLNLAIVQQKQGKYGAAIENYQAILSRENTISPDAHFGLGCCHFRQNKLKEALRQFQLAIKYNPSFVDAYINLGVVWERLGGIQEGVDALQDAIALSPGNARAYYNLGVIWEKVGNLPQAMKTYEKAIELNYPGKAEIMPRVRKMKEVLSEMPRSTAS